MPRGKWFVLLAASYFFYMSWDPRFISLILISTVVDYIATFKIESSTVEKHRKRWLWFSLFTNLGLLFTFKYLGFFNQSVDQLAEIIGWNYQVNILKLILPMGISFYTFQTLSYTIDVYHRKVKRERHFGIFALYVSYFPQLVAGPIERPGNLLPQLKKRISFSTDKVRCGCALILWGLFKKAVIADRAAVIVNPIFDDPTEYSGLVLLLAVIMFAFQIYGDFSGYSDIAIGSAMILGHDLSKNFDRPYHSKSISEFWNRWHISLSTWFRDYVYIPLGGSRVIKFRWYMNLLVTFLVSGIWHGAAYTFLVWGLLHGLYVVFSYSTHKYREQFTGILGINRERLIYQLFQICITFSLVCVGWVFFRSNSLSEAFYILRYLPHEIIRHILSVNSLSDLASFTVVSRDFLLLTIVFILIMELIQVVQYFIDPFQKILEANFFIRWPVYLISIFTVLLAGVYSNNEFIYFQF